MTRAATTTRTVLWRAAQHPLAALSVLVLLLVVAFAIAAPGVTGAGAQEGWPALAEATRASLLTALIGVTVSVIAGTACGLAAGVYAGHFNTLICWLAYATASVPALIFLVAVLVNSSRSLTSAMVVFGVLTAAPAFLLARSTVLSVERRPTMTARRQQGLTTARMLTRSVFPAIRHGLLAVVLLQCSLMVGIHSLLTFLGLGGEPGASWGSMIREALRTLPGGSAFSWAPGVLLLLTMASLSALGLSIRRSGFPLAPTKTFLASADADADGRWILNDPLPSTWFRSAALIDVRGLRIRSGAGPESPEVVCGVSLTIARGETVGLLGTENSGAHEIALAIAGLLGPTTTICGGSIHFDGVELVGMPERSLARLRGTGFSYLPRDPLASLDPAHTVANHLRTPLRKTVGLSRTAATARSFELLRRVGFSDPRTILALRPGELTPLMAERVLIAGAISCTPRVMIIHDPAATLGGPDAAVILELLRGLQQELDLTLLVVTQRVRLLVETCRQVAVVQAGMIVEHASIGDLCEAPQHPHTRELVSADITP